MRALKLSCLIMSLGLFACGPKVAIIELSPKALEITKKGGVVALAAVPKDAEGKKIEEVALAFSSTDPTVATVDAQSGKITAVKSGEAKVTATFGQISAVVPVRVAIPASISLAPSMVRLDGVGEKANVTAKVLDEIGREVKVPVTWESGDEKIASAKAGEVTAAGAGETQVFAVAGALRAPVKVVVPRVEAIDVDKAVELKIGETPVKLKVVGKDAEGKEIARVQFKYAIDNVKIATVDEAGTLAGVAKGKTKVTISSGDTKAVVEVKVKK